MTLYIYIYIYIYVCVYMIYTFASQWKTYEHLLTSIKVPTKAKSDRLRYSEDHHHPGPPTQALTTTAAAAVAGAGNSIQTGR